MCACLLAALVLSQIAKADTITFLDSNGSIQVDVTYIFNGNRNTERVAAGQYNFHINGSTLTSSGFCTDLLDYISNGNTWSALRTPYPTLQTAWEAFTTQTAPTATPYPHKISMP